MKVGDLVSLSAAGSQRQYNMMLVKNAGFGRYAGAKYGMISKIMIDGGLNGKGHLYTVRWFGFDGKPYRHATKQNHYRYEIKKFKIK
ncbi:MAG: hypothetical protein GOVbin703_198 [Prokaryotic dsDNA virus sp.]|nr:MAG: hypothetical protein GOVbin703_198 [Prokaryotic dsDNA virus sp.]